MFTQSLLTATSLVRDAESLDQVWPELVSRLTELLQVEDVRLFRRDAEKPEVVAISSRRSEIRHPLSCSSVAGFTALSQMPILIRDLNSPKELGRINSDLRYDTGYDQLIDIRARTMISLPLRHEGGLLGVLQLVNHRDGTSFGRRDEAVARLLADVVARKLHQDLNVLNGPFDLLLQRGLLSAEQLERAGELARKRNLCVSSLLRRDFNVAPDTIGLSLERFYRVKFMRYSGNAAPTRGLLQGMSLEYLKANLWVPITLEHGHAVILMADPNNLSQIEEIRRIIPAQTYEFNVGLGEEILAYLGDRGGLPVEDTGDVSHIPDDAALSEEESLDDEENEENLQDAFSELEEESADVHFAPVKAEEEEDISVAGKQITIRLVNKIIIHAHRIKASDVHIEPGRKGGQGVVRMRIDGICRRVSTVAQGLLPSVISRIKVISGLNIAERRKPQDGKARVRFKGREIEMRVATLPTVNGESAVLRMLSSGRSIPFDKLNLSSHNVAHLLSILEHPHGIFLVVGPTGSGKTTTLHAILGKLNTSDRKILTVEDPVEIAQPGLQQVQVDPQVGLSFASVMRSFLRADPDVILVGEMRDSETAKIGVEASLTGHMVLSTLHTNSAAETITRLLELGVDAFNFADAFLGVLAQRLVRTICPDCGRKRAPSVEELESLQKMYGNGFRDMLNDLPRAPEVRDPVGCDRCSGTGYRGRTAVHELITTSPQFRRLILDGKDAESLREQALIQGTETLLQDGIQKILQGDIDILQLRRVVLPKGF